MKKLLTASMILAFALSLTAGIAMASNDTRPMNCPACGYTVDGDLHGT